MDANEERSAATCLFTGAPLTEATREEHTIPRKLGGRIRSKIVSSDEFNNKCGSWADNFLVDAYSDIMATLGPLLPAEFRSGEIDIEIDGEDRRYAVDGLGGVFQKGAAVRKRDPATGRPTEVAGRDKERLGGILGEHGETKWRTEAATSADIYRRRKATICAEVEFSALKSALLTFDHLLADSDRRFTREPALANVRDFVRQTVQSQELDAQLMRRFSLGLQYDKLSIIHDLRAAIPRPVREFEHVLIASGNMGTRTLDVVWLILGFDPFGFRVSFDRRDADFSCIVLNDPLRDGTVDGPYWGFLPPGTSHICAPTSYRAMQTDDELNRGDLESVGRDIADRRIKAQAHAICLVEHTADDYVWDCIGEIALVDNESDHLIANAIRERLRRLYARCLDDLDRQKVFDRIVAIQLRGLPDERIHSDSEKQAICWRPWLSAYRAALSELTCELGLPGEGFPSEPNVGVDNPTGRKLGESRK